MSPANDEGPTVAAVALQESKQVEGLDFQCDGIALQAVLSIEGEEYAGAYIERLHAGMAQPGELAVLMSFLTGDLLYGACVLIEKALEGRHRA